MGKHGRRGNGEGTIYERTNGSATSTYLLTLSEATHEEVCW